MQGNGIVPFFFLINCAVNGRCNTTRIENLLSITLLQDEDNVFPVEVKITPGNNIKVFLDADNGITIDKCIKINQGLYKQIEEAGIISQW